MDFVWTSLHYRLAVFIAGCLAATWWPAQLGVWEWFPVVGWGTLSALSAVGAWWFRKKRLASALLLFLAGLSLCCTQISNWQLHSWPDSQSGQLITVTGQVSGLVKILDDHPGDPGVGFILTGVVSNDYQNGPKRLSLRWYRNKPIESCQWWKLRIRMKSARGWANPYGYSRKASMQAGHIHALATVISAQRVNKTSPVCIDRWRSESSEQLKRVLGWQPTASAIVPALLFGDRRFLSRHQRQLFVETGTSHLIAISGLHLALVAWGCWWLFGLLFRLLVLPSSAMVVRPSVLAVYPALVLSLAYVFMSGAALSAQRAWIMIAVLLVCHCRQKHPSLSLSLLLAMAAVLLFDPLAQMSTGFWLSFLAVWIIWLLSVFSFMRSLVGLQLALSLVLGGVSSFWFALWPLFSVPANLLMVPLFSFVLVPLAFAGWLLLILFGEPLLLDLFAGICEWVTWGMGQLVSVSVTLPALPDALFVVVLLLALFALLTPGLVPVAFPVMAMAIWVAWHSFVPTGKGSGLSHGEFSVRFFDVGQGTAVVIRTHSALLMYDTGPGWRSGDAVSMAVLPWLFRQPEPVSLFLVSHADMDHSGGVTSLSRHYPHAGWLSGEAERVGLLRYSPQSAMPCQEGQSWQIDGVRFEVVWPAAGIPVAHSNNHSCVLRVHSPAGEVLLTGDIERPVEHWLVGQEESLGANLLLVPHHGSKTSSSFAFIRAVRPDLAIVTAGWNNRFGHPAKAVEQRYQQFGVPLWNTADMGHVEVLFASSDDGSPVMQATGWREPGRVLRINSAQGL